MITLPQIPGGIRRLPVQLYGADPHCRYRGVDCLGTSWPADGFGDTLVEAGSGGSPARIYSGAVKDYGVLLSGGAKVLQAPNNTLCQVLTNEDYVLEWVVEYSPSAVVFSKQHPSDNSAWYEIQHLSANTMQGGVQNLAGTTNVHGCSHLTSVTHGMRFFRRGGRWKSYGNTAESDNGTTAPSDMGTEAIGASGFPFQIGQHLNSQSVHRRITIYYFAMWKGVGLLADDTHQPTVNARYNLWTGIKDLA